jgi:putative mRNA 3-end processing factor
VGLITSNTKGLYCKAGKFYIDPWGKVKTAVITHAHSDHLRRGSQNYITSKRSHELVDHRLPEEDDYSVTSYDFDETFEINGVTVSLHPAGHVLGSSQVRLEYKGEVTVLTGDYKRQADPSCEPFVQLQADELVTEATFGLPIYRWSPGEVVMSQISRWILQNREKSKTSVIFGYSLGKTQRILAELAQLPEFEGETVYIHGALDATSQIYRQHNIKLLDTELVVDQEKGFDFSDKLVLAPPGSFKSKFMNRFKDFESGFASGWMRVRGRRRMGGYDTGFVMSDHADWPGLLTTVRDSGANEVYVGFTKSPTFVRYLRDEMGYDAAQLNVRYSSEDD